MRREFVQNERVRKQTLGNQSSSAAQALQQMSQLAQSIKRENDAQYSSPAPPPAAQPVLAQQEIDMLMQMQNQLPVELLNAVRNAGLLKHAENGHVFPAPKPEPLPATHHIPQPMRHGSLNGTLSLVMDNKPHINGFPQDHSIRSDEDEGAPDDRISEHGDLEMLSMATQDDLVGVLFKTLNWAKYRLGQYSDLLEMALPSCWVQLFLVDMLFSGQLDTIKEEIVGRLETHLTDKSRNGEMVELAPFVNLKNAMSTMMTINGKILPLKSQLIKTSKTTLAFHECMKYAIISSAVAFHNRSELGNMDGTQNEGLTFFDDHVAGMLDADKINVLLAIQNLTYLDTSDVELIFFKGVVGHNTSMSEFINDIVSEVLQSHD